MFFSQCDWRNTTCDLKCHFRNVMVPSYSTGCLIKMTAWRSSNGCLIQMTAVSGMREQGTMATIIPGQSRRGMCVRICCICVTHPWRTMQVFWSLLPQQILLPVFPPGRCCRPPTRQTATSSMLSWLEAILYQARLCGLRIPVTVGSVRIPRQTR